MIFNEIYSAYYNAIAEILACLVKGKTDDKTLQEAVKRHAFSESVLTVLPALESGKWQLMRKDKTTSIHHTPTMPLTKLQKSWLKAISLDPRIRLFDMDFSFLSDTEPLFTADDYYIYDSYADSDPYGDEAYITNFRTILSAIRENKALHVETVNRHSKRVTVTVLPKYIEYSQKDDKFRVYCAGHKFPTTMNIARIITCRKCFSDTEFFSQEPKSCTQTLTLRITDERNALERTMLHFAHFQKQVERIDDKTYLLRLSYEAHDETELVIRVLSFGPLVEVTEPKSFRNLIKERLEKQKSCGLI